MQLYFSSVDFSVIAKILKLRSTGNRNVVYALFFFFSFLFYFMGLTHLVENRK